MNAKLFRSGVFGFVLVSLALFAGTAEFALAQGVVGALPANATARAYGNSWECDSGYRKDGGTCVAVTLPGNAYLTSSTYGSGWDCQHGYRKSNEGCAAVELPMNAHLGSVSGDRWLCDRGYQKVGTTCEAIQIPAKTVAKFTMAKALKDLVK